MTLSELALPIAYEKARQYALVFSPKLASRLAELHAMYGRPDCVAEPELLTDGRMMLCADLLTAIYPGGWLHGMWEAADKSVLLASVDVMPMSEAERMVVRPII